MATSMFRRSLLKQLFSIRNYSDKKPHPLLCHGDPKQLDAAEKMWKALTIYGIPPVLLLAGLNVYLSHEDEERPEYIKYDYRNIRTKPYPWGDGNRTLFHNPKVNPLPDGYEDE